MATTTASGPLSLLRELLEDDRRAGIPWTAEDFAQRVDLVCRATNTRSWFDPIIQTAGAWRDAYIGQRAGELEHFGASLLVHEPCERLNIVVL